jgi:hypothetical protein
MHDPLGIIGHRNLSQEEINKMNVVKALGEACSDLMQQMESNINFDQRWVAIAKTHLQEGVMAAVRAIAKPTTF